MNLYINANRRNIIIGVCVYIELFIGVYILISCVYLKLLLLYRFNVNVCIPML